jgi:predicted SAM-dependent methyltransferase
MGKIKQEILKEFQDVTHQLAGPKGIKRYIFNISNWLSLNFTTLLQMSGYNRKVLKKANKKGIILNIGCGEINNPEYVNTDLFPTLGDLYRIVTGKAELNNQMFLDITQSDACLFNSADGIILSHVLEHIAPHLAPQALVNCYKYLKTGGVIRVSVPYLGAYEKENLPPNQRVAHRMLAKNRLIYGWHHKFMYDTELIVVLLEAAGFKNVAETFFRQGILGESDIEGRASETIYITGVK